jgi:alkylation response protein AidB-like acyl-CoA dehydrogenase
MGQLNAKTLEYTKTREQFGVPIGSFQALQHRMVDTFMSYEQAKSMLYRAVCALDNDDDDLRREIHALKVMISRCGKHIFEEAIQLHGGMGITDELDIAHYAKRLMMINATFGDGDYHQARFNALSYGDPRRTRAQRGQHERRGLIRRAVFKSGPLAGALFASGDRKWS